MRCALWGLLGFLAVSEASAVEPSEPTVEPPAALDSASQGSDLDAAKTVAAQAQLALEAFDGATAAAHFERANHLDGQAIWLFAAAEAWLVAAEPGRALEHLKAVRASQTPVAPERVEAALKLVESLVGVIGRARAATLSQAHAEAANAWGEAHALKAVGRYRLEQAKATLRAGQAAEPLLAELELRRDLSRAERLEVADLLVRVRNPLPDLSAQAVDAPSSAPMWMVVGGGALVVGGVVALVVADGQRGDVRASLDREPGARAMTRAEALATWEQAQTLNTVGLIGGGLGAVLAGSGALWGTVGGLGFQF